MGDSRQSQGITCFLLLLLVTWANAIDYMNTNCGETISAGDSGGVLKSQTRDYYGNYMDCTVTIGAEPGRLILLAFDTMDIDSGWYANDYLQVYDGASSDSSMIGDGISGTTTPDDITSTRNTITLRFKTDESGTGRGFTIAYTSFKNAPCDDDEFVCKNLRCIDSSLENNDYDNCGDFSDEYKDFTRHCDETLSAERSGGELKFQGKGEDDSLDCNVTIEADSDRRILLTFAKLNMGDCQGTYLQVYDGPPLSSSAIGNTICSSPPLHDITSTSNVITLRFKTGSSRMFGAFTIAYTAYSYGLCGSDEFLCNNHRCIDSSLENNKLDNCGDNSDEYTDYMDEYCDDVINAHDSGGVLKSQRSDRYDDNVNCKVIIVADTDRRILLTFAELDIDGEGYVCEYDYLQAYDGLPSTSSVMGEDICGTSIPAFITSKSNSVTLTFNTDDSVTGRGFTIAYTSFKYAAGSGEACDIGEYKCSNRLCIDPSLVNNGYDNCGDNSDEGLSTGIIAAIVCGCLVALVIIIICAVTSYRMRYKKRRPAHSRVLETQPTHELNCQP